MKVSCAVMAHPARQHLVDELLPRLGLDDDHVVWDRRNEEWDTGVRSWQAHDPAADWHLVIQDDAIVCRDLLPGLERGLDTAPTEAVVSLYLGDSRPWETRVRRAGVKTSWVRMPSLIWGVAMAAPVATIPGMLDWCAGYYNPAYDTRIGRYYATVLGWPAYYTWPSLTDHRQVPSLLDHRGERRAHRFLGEDTSALTVQWSSKAIDL